ncbi:unnamed protein product [Phyllotreta striolata]|uniref:Rrn7/TAF1B C-terminal cyclin domain-containing protein n=1 Tax=Phyllotreta striolata TaxID=444603 RepID=A0A9N9TVY8_PHYSR|nr:unnamed protein product [Phyllotreta striolata]
MECVVCGGTNFIKESGYFFCSECQTQSQEVQEHVFQDEATEFQIKGAKRVRDKKAKGKFEQLTSWECYNVVLLSLTEELIKLGADPSIKKIVKTLWMRYLEKLQVINFDEDKKPKFSLIGTKRDIAVTYGLEKRKRVKKEITTEENHVDQISRRERSKKKMALAKSLYSQDVEEWEKNKDLHNETLATLKNPAASSESSKQISFNKYSLGELRSTVCKEHIQVHKRDLRLNLKCHKFTHETCSIDYTKGAYIISPLRIYSILYIALLVKRDVIHLGDLLRFLREGYLNCNRFSSLFPDSYADKILNIQDNSIKGIYSHTVFRSTASKMIEFLEIQDYIVCPDLSILAERYCSELNLPDEIVNMVQHILLENPIKFSGTIPNYEGRVMSVIIFVLKILFGLDGVTERHFSKYAQQCNRIVSESRMFDIINWLEFIEYRKLVISENHLPTSHLHDNEINLNPDLFLQYKYTHNIFVSDRNRIVSDMVGYKNLLSRIQNLQQDYIPAIEFLPNLTPFKNYSDIIAPSKMSQNIKLILNRNFRRDSLDFLLRSKQYFDDSSLFHDEGANKNYKLEHMKTHHECAYFIEPKNKKFVPVRLLDNSDGSSGSEEVEDERSFAKYASSISSENEAAYNRHYHPHKRHWLYLRGRIEMASKEKFEEFFSKHSVGFRTIVRECCRVIEESPAELLSQLQHTELYLIYCGNFSNSIERRHASKLGPYLRQAESNW